MIEDYRCGIFCTSKYVLEIYKAGKGGMMRRKLLFGSVIIITIFLLNVIGGSGAQAGTKDLTAGKKVKYKDDNVESMRDIFKRSENEEKTYRKTMLVNSYQTIELLKQIRDLLQQLNQKE